MTTFKIPNLYLPPVHLLSAIAKADVLVYENLDRYQKQTYRNRAKIIGANGVQVLTVPVVSGHSLGMHYKDVKIAYDTRWQQVHWRAITSSYKSSPFFEYYQDHFSPFYHKEYPFLYDFNLELNRIIFDIIDFRVPKTIHLLSEQPSQIDLDLSPMVVSKSAVEEKLTQPPYWQVFDSRFSFTPGMSVLDLIFNAGTESYLYLEQWNESLLSQLDTL